MRRKISDESKKFSLNNRNLTHAKNGLLIPYITFFLYFYHIIEQFTKMICIVTPLSVFSLSLYFHWTKVVVKKRVRRGQSCTTIVLSFFYSKCPVLRRQKNAQSLLICILKYPYNPYRFPRPFPFA